MHRRTLDPPRPAAHPDLPRVRLDAPHTAIPERRPHFRPRRGWFRRIERAVSLALSRNVWPRLPGAALPYGFILGRGLTVADAEVAVPGLGSGLDGVAILFVSDVHAGPFLSPRALARAFAKLAGLGADVVIHGGDLATTSVREVLPHLDALASLRAPLGVFAVLGNHDHYAGDLPALAECYRRVGVRLLDNDAVALERGGSRMAMAGIDDWNFGRPDLRAALSAAHAAAPDAPVVLASHNPDAFFAAAGAGVRLVLSGHTHGGQVRIPGLPVLVRMSRYRLDEGRYERGGTHIVVSRGLGVSGIPLRLFCRPEALRVTLRSA